MRLQKVTGLTSALLVSFVSIGALLTLFPQTAEAKVEGWKAGNIISDDIFTNKRAMTESQIQKFLESKVPKCDTYGAKPSEFGGGTRRQWAEARGNKPPYTCLRDYWENGTKASKLIYQAAQEYSINPQVLLVLLQKEQGLVTDEWPMPVQYKTATGYGCPDTAPCDSQYFGLKNQLRQASRMFRAIMNNSPTWYTPYVLGKNYIQYSPTASCGGSNVTIANRATQALYNYTPYQPNKAALNAGWGTAPCGAYGNRNFFLYFSNWFGNPRSEVIVTGEIAKRYNQIGQAGSHIGKPVANQKCNSDNTSCSQKFQRGYILWGKNSGAWEVRGGIRTTFERYGAEHGRLGHPETGQICSSSTTCYQRFVGGYIMWKAGVGAWENLDEIRDRYVEVRAERGYLGYPAGRHNCNSAKTECYQKYEKGHILYKESTGAWDVKGSIRARYEKVGVEHGKMGYPTSGEICSSTGCHQKFENGVIYFSKKTGAWENKGSIRQRYIELGVEHGNLGYPIGGETCTSKGCYQRFERGYILHRTSTGSWETKGSIRKVYEKNGVEHGRLGYPTSGENCDNDTKTCFQEFEGGRIDYDLTTKKAKVSYK